MPWLFFTVLLIGILCGAEVDLFIPSFPELQKVFHLTPVMVQLTLSANFIPYCICSLFSGTLGDRYNRRYVMLVSLTIFVIGSILCVFALNFPMLILGRFLQGTGMAGPAVLSFVTLADTYPLEKQPAILGTLNGIVTLAMACAPVVGSYINLYFNWQGNFFVLLSLSIIALICSYFFIPNRKGDLSISLSLKSYWPLLQSKKLMVFVFGLCFLGVPYWTFIGISPILYIEGMGVNLEQFGFYQGALAGIFSIVSIFSTSILKALGIKKCLYYSLLLYITSALVIFWLTIFKIHHPLIITCGMAIYSVSVVFPINLLYPFSLEIIDNSKSRTAALINGFRLLLTASMLELVSYFYCGTFLPLGFAILSMIIFSLPCLWKMSKAIKIDLNPFLRNHR